MSTEKRELEARFFALIERAFLFMRAEAEEEGDAAALTKLQLRALVLLRRGPLRMGELAQNLGSTLSSTTSLLDRLVARGLAERLREETDRRGVTCRLTVAGEDVVEAQYRRAQAKFQALTELLSLEELRTLVSGMEVLAAGMERVAAAGERLCD